jgi:hypothetical protein
MKRYQQIARDVAWYKHVYAMDEVRPDLEEMADEKLHVIEKDLPSGSGIDSGCKVDLDACNENRLVITFKFHHMDEHGYYCGWADYKATLRPSMQYGFDMKITGRYKNQIKDYLYQTFDYYFNQEVN